MGLQRLSLRLVAAWCALAVVAPACARTSDTGAVLPDTPDHLVTWMRRHPQRYALVIRSGNDVEVDHAGARQVPVGDARTFLVAGAYAEAVAAHRLDPLEKVDVASVGGRGDAAVEALHDRRRVVAGHATLQNVAAAAARFPSSGAASYLSQRVGGDAAVAAFAARAGVGAGETAKAADYAALAQQVQSGGSLPADVLAPLRRAVSWPLLDVKANRERFSELAAVSARSATAFAEVTYLRRKGKAPIAAALFLFDVPPAAAAALRRTSAHQGLLVSVAAVPDVLDKVKRRLAPSGGG